jgi:hypothetical protein
MHHLIPALGVLAMLGFGAYGMLLKQPVLARVRSKKI